MKLGETCRLSSSNRFIRFYINLRIVIDLVFCEIGVGVCVYVFFLNEHELGE